MFPRDHCKAMKISFSLSSLQPLNHGLEKHGQAGVVIERPYNSLTKKRKDPKQFHNQRLWTNREDCKDEFWAAIRSNYDYIMDTNLIDSCKEANGELTWDETDVSTQSWSLKEVSSQFSELYSWLRVLQELVYSKEENLLDKSLRAAHMEELRRRAYRRKLFNEQAAKLVSHAPALKDEVAWRVDHLNAKWELVEQMMAPVDRLISDQQDISADFEHEVKCLRKWLREMESRLQPLSFHVDWTLAELEEKAVEHMVLQRDIEAHGRIVSSVVKLGDKVYNQQQGEQQEQGQKGEERQEQQEQREPSQVLRTVKSLERRWHLLFLRALEWQCHIETLVSRVSSKNLVPYSCSSDSDEEPVTKQPRLSRRHSRGSGRESPGQSARSTRSKRHRATRSRYYEDQAASRADLSDTDAFSENRSIGDGSYFEDELCQLCVMDIKSGEGVENPQEINRISCASVDQAEEGDIEEDAVTEDEEYDMPPIPDTVPLTNSTAIVESCDQIDGQSGNVEQPNGNLAANEPVKRRRTTEEVASFNTSDRKSKNYATFYFCHLDTDSEQNEEAGIVVEDSSEEEWTYTSSRGNNNVTSEQRKTNVLVRLDFGEGESPEPRPTVDIAKTSEMKPVKETRKDVSEGVDETSNETDASSQREKDSDDETRNDKTRIQRLIKEVEKLVGEERRNGAPRTFSQLILDDKGSSITNNHRAKYARIKEWLKLNNVRGHEGRSTLQPLDSCDASGEYTTEDSDVERQSVSSEDLQSSVATYRRFEGALGCTSVSQEIFDDPERTPVNEGHPMLVDAATPKVVMRSKQKTNGPRPWSVSCISQIGNNSNLNQTNDPISQFSISETALHQLIATPPTKSVSLDATGSRKSFNNSTSTLLEESIICHDGRMVRNSSLRRKKSRLRKKNLGRKSDSSLEGVNAANHSAGSDGSSSNQQRSPRKVSGNRAMRTISRDCHGRLTTLVKSGSFSGCTAHQQLSAERTIVSDPTPPFRLPCCTSVASTSETEGEEQRNRTRGCFPFDDNLLDTVLNNKELCNQQLNMDSDIEMNSLGNNSFSEQAWDNYQEKYMSEPYSEAPDIETARRLLDFGDDYRNFLDSQSDCASSMSAIAASSPLPRSRMHHEITDTTEDSDSDVDDIRNIVEKSQSQLSLAENLFSRSNNGSMPEDFTELECTCRENLRCLHTLLESVSNSFRSEKYVKQIRGMLEKWESLTTRVEETQMATALHRELTTLRTEFKAAHDRLFSYEIILEQPHVLDERINRITAELAALRDRKAAMLALNVSTHRLITDLGNSASLIFTALKDGVADLYRVWDETFQKGNQQLCALQAVQQFSIRLSELQCALRRDKDTLAVLDVALQAGATSEVASSVRHVARLLSEKQDISCQNGTVVLKDSSTEEVGSGVSGKFGDSSPISLTEGGSLSDSGISDSGSEQELSERERRLAALRRLTRSLESQLAPGSEALVELLKRVEDAETELRDLQKQCRELIVRTAASVEARAAKRTSSNQVHHFVEYRDDALCWTDRKPSVDDVGNPTSVNARFDERHYAFESILELRKEKSRDAARSRRGKENFEFYELAKMLPLPAAITSQLDKASIIRLTISYLKLREFSGHGDPPWNRDGPPPNKSGKGANRVRSSASAAMDHFDVHQGTHILQSLDGFAMAVAADGRFLYISETVSIYLGLSQVEMTGSSVFDYVHQQDHAEVAEQLGLGLTSSTSSGPHSSSSGLASPSSAASEEHGSSSTANPDVSSVMSLSANNLYKGYDRAFCVRMKSTLTKRGCHFKSSGYRVVLLLCRLRPQYTFSHTRKSAPPLIGMVGLAIALPPPSVHEIRLETDMFVTRINFDFRIAHCEPRVSELLDYTADELTGKNLYTLCHGEDANRLRKSHIDLIHKGQVLTHYYRLMNKSGGYTWLQTCATVVCNSKNAEEQNIICVNYVISGREYENLIMDCCQLEEGVMGVKREDAAGNDPENGSPDADRGEGRNHGGPPNQHQEHPHRSPPEDREDTRGSESEKRGSRHHDNIAQLQQEPQTAVGNISTLVVKLRGHKRKLHEDDSSSNEEEDEEDDSTEVSKYCARPVRNQDVWKIERATPTVPAPP
ncbi:uncharacterized protein LOC107998930 isoform X11 [Apis cerana]|uniref:uncharacterized protein LOC107998930 isoform X11 n=1 Tax=Apis cerana TaxID=7461 RepID=UPI002B223E40|nr:uncharacterized protein LOC107998930 isoform X11 [Apis cerana]